MDDTCLLRLRSTGEEPLMKAALESARTHPGTVPPVERAPKEADERRVAWESQERGVAEGLCPKKEGSRQFPLPLTAAGLHRISHARLLLQREAGLIHPAADVAVRGMLREPLRVLPGSLIAGEPLESLPALALRA